MNLVYLCPDWKFKVWHIRDFQDVSGCSYHTVNNHLIKLCRDGWLVKAACVYPVHYFQSFTYFFPKFALNNLSFVCKGQCVFFENKT